MNAKDAGHRIIADGAECFDCGEIVKGRAVLWLYRKNPATGKRERWKPHPKPYRRYKSKCGRMWKRRIAKSQLKRARST